jgi:hypothetical protein
MMKVVGNLVSLLISMSIGYALLLSSNSNTVGAMLNLRFEELMEQYSRRNVGPSLNPATARVLL